MDLDLEGRLSDLSWGERGEREIQKVEHIHFDKCSSSTGCGVQILVEKINHPNRDSAQFFFCEISHKEQTDRTSDFKAVKTDVRNGREQSSNHTYCD